MHFFAEQLESAAIISVMIYLAFSFRLVKSYQRSLLNNVSNTAMINLRWVNQFIFAATGSFMLIIVFVIIGMIAGGKFAPVDWEGPRAYAMLIYSCVLYWLSISGFKQAQTHQMLDLEHASDADNDEYSEVIQRLCTAIEVDKLYKNPELSLLDLSRSVEISERVISNAINQELGKNFFQFINEYRVEEVKERLKDPAQNHFKIISLAFDAGFNSKASFNRVFKSYTGRTPIDYKSENS